MMPVSLGPAVLRTGVGRRADSLGPPGPAAPNEGGVLDFRRSLDRSTEAPTTPVRDARPARREPEEKRETAPSASQPETRPDAPAASDGSPRDDAEPARPSAAPETESGPAVPSRPGGSVVPIRPASLLGSTPVNGTNAPSPLPIAGTPAARIPLAPAVPRSLPTTPTAPVAVPQVGTAPLPAAPNVLGADAARPVVVSTTIAAPAVEPDAVVVPWNGPRSTLLGNVRSFPARAAAPTASPTADAKPSVPANAPSASVARSADAGPVLAELSAPRPEFSATLHMVRLAELFQKPLSIDATRKPGIDGPPSNEIKTRPQARRQVAADEPTAPSGPATRAETKRAAEPAAQGRESGLDAPRSPRTPEANALPQSAKDAAFDPKAASVTDVRVPADPKLVADHRASILEQVRDSFAARAETGGNVRLTLHPKELGRVDVRLSVRDGAMSAWIVAEDKAVRDVLVTHQGDLRSALESDGVRLQEFSVSVRDDRQPSFRDLAGQAGDGRSRQNGGSAPSPAIGEADPVRHARYVDPRALVDLVV